MSTHWKLLLKFTLEEKREHWAIEHKFLKEFHMIFFAYGKNLCFSIANGDLYAVFGFTERSGRSSAIHYLKKREKRAYKVQRPVPNGGLIDIYAGRSNDAWTLTLL